MDELGLPPGDAVITDVIAGWQVSGTTPRGAPVGMTVARDGTLWVVDDKNGTVLRLSADPYAGHRINPDRDQASTAPLEVSSTFARAHRRVLVPRCSRCHQFITRSPDKTLQALRAQGWISKPHGKSALSLRLRPDAVRPMPPDGTLTATERELIQHWLSED
jgi:hypothetical protein